MKIVSSHTKSLSPVRVNVRLCGGIPRKDLADQLSLRVPQFPLGDLTLSDVNASLFDAGSSSTSDRPTHPKEGLAGLVNLPRIRCEQSQPLAPVFDPPSWAVPACGESRLEPVCEALGLQPSVDLTSRSCFRIGRSPTSDVQLVHITSSRRHALLFHHTNGSCYIVDCGSAHGTYVNGVRVSSPPKGGVVVPHKVRRGAMIRFGGPGAPCFVLKSFSFKLQDLAESTPNVIPAEIPSVQDDPAVVQKNTRLNALGRTATDIVRHSVLSMTTKRSFETLETAETFDEPYLKRMRCSSPPPSPEEPLRLVSPDLPSASKLRRVTFSPEPPMAFYPPSVTPELSGDEGGF